MWAYEMVRRNHEGVGTGIELRSARPNPVPSARRRPPGGQLAALAAFPSEPPRAVPSADGPLRRMLFCYPAYADNRSSYRLVYEDLFRQLPATTELIVIVHDEVRADLEAAIAAAGAQARTSLVAAPSFLHFLVWSEDPFVALEGGGDLLRLVEPVEFPRAGDALLAELLSAQLSVSVGQSALPLEGGNMLTGDDFVLVGADLVPFTAAVADRLGHLRLTGETPMTDVVRDLLRASVAPGLDVHFVGVPIPALRYERRPILVGGRPFREERFLGIGVFQPIFHIDMFLTLAGRADDGRYRVLVGSPTMADVLLERPTVPQALAWAFDDIAEQLRRAGFVVVRNPLPITYVDYVEDAVRSWYFATSNNCLVQIDAARGNTVWLPTYGHGDWQELRVTDDANAQVWSRLGFEVKQLADYHRFAQNLGSVHCMAKCVARAAPRP